jgi:hypothetical protein
MAENLDTAVVSQLVAGDTHELKPVTIASGAGVLARGSVLGLITASNHYNQLNPAGSDGTETARAILVEDVDATSEDVPALAFVLGKFRTSDLVWPGGATDAQKKAALLDLQDRGMVVDTDWA